MTTKKKAFVSALSGIGVSGTGFLLVEIGGWGPCGPASTLAQVGGVLGLYHFICLCTWFPALEHLLASVDSAALNAVMIISVPAVTWFLVTFGLLSLWQKVGPMGGTAEPSAAPNGGPASPLTNSVPTGEGRHR